MLDEIENQQTLRIVEPPDRRLACLFPGEDGSVNERPALVLMEGVAFLLQDPKHCQDGAVGRSCGTSQRCNRLLDRRLL